MYADGYSFTQIAKVLLLDDETIRRHINDYEVAQKLRPENGGSQSQLECNAEELIGHLSEVTYLYVKDICAHVKATYGLGYSVSGMTKWLKANGFRYKKPHAVPARTDLEKQQTFIKHYAKLKESAGNKEPIYFLDSCHPAHQTRLVYGWILKGERKAIATTARQYRVNVMGAICLAGHRIIVHQQADRIDAESIMVFLKELRKRHPNNTKLHIIWDRAPYHRSHLVKKYAKILNIKIHYLPPYSPNLNPIERLWKIMHEQVTYNQYYETFAQFKEAIGDFFRHIGKKKIILRARINDHFQTIQMPNFAS